MTVRKICAQILILLVSALVISAPSYWYYKNLKQIVIHEAGKDAEDTAVTLAILIEDDIESYKKLVQTDIYAQGTYDHAYYQRMLAVMRRVRAETHADFVFTEKMISETQVAYILDGEDPESLHFSPIGTTDSMGKDEYAAFVEDRSIATGLVDDPYWGEYLTGYAPIHDIANHEVVGLVGVDYSGEQIVGVMRRLKLWMTILTIVLTIAAAAITNSLLLYRSYRLNTDFLTKLGNKNLMLTRLETLISRAERGGNQFSLLVMDIDNFKDINDQRGHLTGDKALGEVAQAIQSNIRVMDSASRFGGDEFVVLLPGTTASHAITIAQRIRAAIRSLELPPHGEGNPVHLSVSIGIAEWRPAISAADMIERADRAMYEAKNSGKGSIIVA